MYTRIVLGTRLAKGPGMLCRSHSASVVGVDGFIVTVEGEVGLGLPGLTIVGQATGALTEARDRVRAALGHCGHEIRPRRQIVNLAPADARKDSPGIDLAVAGVLLACHEIVPAGALEGLLLWGELGLSGAVRPATGTLVIADIARRHGFTRVAVARRSADEAALIPGLTVLPVDDLPQLIAHLRGERVIDAHARREPAAGDERPILDMADIRGLHTPRRALEVMAAGGHNLLLHGPPGVGKTMLARRAAHLMPALRGERALTATKIHGLAHGTRARSLLTRPPMRAPHHTVTPAGLLGGGSPARPGEVSLAHGGLLFLDELPEFSRACLEGLREPLEEGEVRLVRANHRIHFPARFQLLAAMNPCPCGYLGHPDRSCVDSVAAVSRYQQRVSGPLLDRIDLVVPVAPPPDEVLAAGPGESTAAVAARIARARARQGTRLADTPWPINAEIPATGGAVEELCALEPGAARLMVSLTRARGLSPRTQHRLRRVARTLADLDDARDPALPIATRHLAEAAALRRLPEALAPGG